MFGEDYLQVNLAQSQDSEDPTTWKRLTDPEYSYVGKTVNQEDLGIQPVIQT